MMNLKLQNMRQRQDTNQVLNCLYQIKFPFNYFREYIFSSKIELPSNENSNLLAPV